ncbi:molybdopterin molybdotransferase MoeA [Methylococcus geothermalis]|uniref:Molybdopterin molybdenumtransferase n=1 Tax=Methylococcus geothermalis TaxID=2681310 RepID=A0A858Q7F3_9GAMM|nr:gephyrin-like molybdotransferase Glp [Methylococcus geothermalis]QJD29832.1 molybdopterin molybdenumtransferase MoeA [Methylococcus geothermalis]
MKKDERHPVTCEDDYEPDSLTVEQAWSRVIDAVQPLDASRTVDLRSALGRVLASDVHAVLAVPSAPNSAMDGYALRASDLPASGKCRLAVIGVSRAGAPYPGKVHSGQCVRIFTGAVMPEGTDTVVMQEHVEATDGWAVFGGGAMPGQNVRQVGEDVTVGQVVLTRGRRLTPADLGVLAGQGLVRVPVYRRLKVGLFTTGDELREPGEALAEGCLYDSNRYTVLGMLQRLGVEVCEFGIVGDNKQRLEAVLAQASAEADAIVSTGGVSVGEYDLVREALEQAGHIEFWKIAMKPGRPLTFGRIGRAAFFGLPGNPVAAMVTFYQFVQPGLRRMTGEWPLPKPAAFKAVCLSKLRKRPGRVEFQRGIVEMDGEGRMVVRKTGQQGSGILSSMSQANCFIVLPLDCGPVAPGALVDVQPFFGLV